MTTIKLKVDKEKALDIAQDVKKIEGVSNISMYFRG